MEFAAERPTLTEGSIKQGDVGLRDYWAAKNRATIDGFLSGMPE